MDALRKQPEEAQNARELLLYFLRLVWPFPKWIFPINTLVSTLQHSDGFWCGYFSATSADDSPLVHTSIEARAFVFVDFVCFVVAIMRKITAITHVTLDGIMQGPGGPEEDPRGGFTHGGWSMAFYDETAETALSEIMSGEFDLLLGRRTYEIFAAYWPYAADDNPIARAFNRAAKFVVTRSLDRFDWANSQRVSGDAPDEIRRLKASDGPELHVWGSGELLQTLIAQDLIDEFRIWVYPVVLGQGRRLFETGVPPRGLALAESRRAPSGVLFNTYRPAGPLPLRTSPAGIPSAAELARRRKLAREDVQGRDEKR